MQRYIGIDGGRSGAWASVDEAGNWLVHLSATEEVDGHTLLSVSGNLAILRQHTAEAGGQGNIVAVYEQCRRNPAFGCKNNFTNGRHEEFWRVFFSLQSVKHRSVDPRTWQSVCLKGIDWPDTKERAREYIRRRCPSVDWLDDYGKARREAIADAMCIALWCKDQYQPVTV
jgi:hypothetical protein